MEAVSKLLQQQRGGGISGMQNVKPKPPLSVIMERSSEDTRALSIETSSRPSSSASVANKNNQSIEWDKDTAELSANVSRLSRQEEPKLSGGFDSFASLSETQARELFDNDAKDRIEFMTSQLDNRLESENNGEGFKSLGASFIIPNESLGEYFIRRSSNPVKGISDESAFHSHLDSTLPPDFDSTRSLSASTPIANRSYTWKSNRDSRPVPTNLEDDSMFEASNAPANESIASLFEYFKGPQCEGKRKESMIEYVLDYCKKQSKELPASSKPSTTKHDKSPVNLDIAPVNSTLDQSMKSTSVLKPPEQKTLNGSKLVRRITESKTQLNFSFCEKSVRTDRAERKEGMSNGIAIPQLPPAPESFQVNLNQLALASSRETKELTASQTVQSSTSTATTSNTGTAVYPNYHYPTPTPYGFPLVIQVYCPYPGQPNPYAPNTLSYPSQPGAAPIQPPFPQHLTQIPGQGQLYAGPAQLPTISETQGAEASAMIHSQVHLNSAQQTEQISKTNSRAETEKYDRLRTVKVHPPRLASSVSLQDLKEHLPKVEENQNLYISTDKLAVVWEGCNIGGFAVEELKLFNRQSCDINVRSSFTDSEGDTFMLFTGTNNALASKSRTIIKGEGHRTIRLAFKPRGTGRAQGKLRLEFSYLEKNVGQKSARPKFTSCIPLVGFGYGEKEDLNLSCLV